MLAVAIERCLHRGQRQREAVRLDKGHAELGQRRFTDRRQLGGKDLDLARWCGEAAIAVFFIGGFKRHADPPWIGPQCLQAEATWRQVMIERRLDIAVPEMLTEAETDRQIENNVDIRARLAA